MKKRIALILGAVMMLIGSVSAAASENSNLVIYFSRTGEQYTVGVIDSDYYYAENEGHIMVSLRNPLKEELRLGKGDRFCQGIFLPYGLAEEEDRPGERKGGFGSTGK